MADHVYRIFTAILFVTVWMFWNHNFLFFWKDYIERFVHLKPEINIVFTPPLMTLSILFGVWLLFALIKLRMNYLKNVIRARIIQQVVFSFFLFGAGSIFLGQKFQLLISLYLQFHFQFLQRIIYCLQKAHPFI